MAAWVPVISTSLRAVSYDPDRRELEVEFTTGGRYRYQDVAPETYAGLMRAESLGAYFNRVIRGHHPYTEIDPS